MSSSPTQPTSPGQAENISPGSIDSTRGTSETRFFDRWRRTFAEVTGMGLSEEQWADVTAERQRKRCFKMRDDLVTYSPAVVFMLERIEKETGVRINPVKQILCLPCGTDRSGGFVHQYGAVLLCQNHFWSRKQMEQTLTHELVHLYDHCKFKPEWSNLRHHACSEIRANSLGGDCKWAREVRRLFFNFSKQHQACVRRRAVVSVSANPACGSVEEAERAVNEVWESCFKDTRPFDEIY